MSLIIRIAVGTFLLLTGFKAYASVDCIRPVATVWSGYDENRIYVVYRDQYAHAGMRLVDVANDERVVSRTLSVILAGHLTGRTITFRYSQGSDGSTPSCTPTVA